MASGLITPNFSSDSLGRHTNYIEQLSRRYATLSKLVLEEPRDEADEGRILALREKVQEAWSRAEGNPASGKWVRITQLLRMGVTSGRGGKWVGARTDLKSPECPENASGWISTMSEADWIEWEQKFIQDQRVETWKKGVEDTKHRPTTSKIVNMPPKDLPRGRSHLQLGSGIKSVPTASIDPLKGSSPFGFGVVKHTSQTNVLSGKPSASGNKLPSNSPYPPAVSEAPEMSKEADKPSVRRPKEQTTSGAELSSRRPSFSGPLLLTSTPKRTAKPSLVAQSEVSSPLTPLISSPSKRTLLGRASSLAAQSKTAQNDAVRRSPGVANVSPLPVMTSLESPLRHTTSQHMDSDIHNVINTNNKRTLSSSHSYPVSETDSRNAKKPKTISSNKPTPQTPPRGQGSTAVPTLTELLASAKKAKKKRPQRKELGHKQHSTSQPAQASGDGEESPPFFDPYPVDDGGGKIIQGPESHAAETRRWDPHLNNSHADLASPARLLSSDDEEEEAVGLSIIGGGIDEYILDSSFRPLATSTQVQAGHRDPFVSGFNITQPDDPPRPGGNGGNITDSWESIYAPRHSSDPFLGLSATSDKNKDTSFPQLSYNTQFESDVAAQAKKVDKLLQRDVEYGLVNDTPVKNKERDEEHDGSESVH